MSPTILSTALQSATLKVVANLIAQILQDRKEEGPLQIDFQRTALFAVFGLVTSPLNSLWHQYLEQNFPTRRVEPSQRETQADGRNPDAAPVHDRLSRGSDTTSSQQRVNWANISIKLLLDQTLGQVFMISTFLIITKYPQVGSFYLLLHYIRANLLTILRHSWRLWPLVALINFIFVPVSWRVLVASLVGFGWNIFLSILSSRM